MFLTVFSRELKLTFRRRGDWLHPLVFFTVVVSLFPMGLDPNPEVLAKVAPGVIWVSALLASLLSLENLFRSDFEDGSLEQLVLMPYPLELLVMAKVCAHWCVSGLLLCVLSPLLGVALNLPQIAVLILITTLLLGTPILSLIGAIGAALTVGLRRGGVLISILILPLYVPVLIFGAGAVELSTHNLEVGGQLLLMASMLVLSLTLAPFAIAAALKVSLE